MAWDGGDAWLTASVAGVAGDGVELQAASAAIDPHANAAATSMVDRFMCFMVSFVDGDYLAPVGNKSVMFQRKPHEGPPVGVFA